MLDDEIILLAYRLIGVVGSGEIPSRDNYDLGAAILAQLKANLPIRLAAELAKINRIHIENLPRSVRQSDGGQADLQTPKTEEHTAQVK